MNDLPPVRSGFVRLGVRLRAGEEVTPGYMAGSAGVPMEQVGQIIVTDYEAFVEIHHSVARNARYHLDRVGQTRIAQSCERHRVEQSMRMRRAMLPARMHAVGAVSPCKADHIFRREHAADHQ